MAPSGEGRGKLNRRLILLPTPFQGHIAPMLELATVLRSRGFSITVVHPLSNPPNSSNYPDLDFEPMSDYLTADDFSSIGDFIMTAINTKCEKPFRDCLTRILMNTDSGDREVISCIIYDVVMHFTQSVADQFNLPRLALRTGGLTAFAAFSAFAALREKGVLPLKDPQSEEPLPDLPPLRIKDLPFVPIKDPNVFIEFVVNMTEKSKSSSGLICNAFEEMEEAALSKLRQDLPNCPIFPVGPLHLYSPSSSSSCSSLKKPDYTCMDWLEKQAPRSVIYVSFGSVVAMGQEEMEEMVWGLVDSEQPFLLVLRRDSVRGSDKVQLPQGFEEVNRGRALVVEWAPQPEVLAHPAVGGFWTHSGWNSTLESVGEGVPMLCRPTFGDQHVNARCITHALGMGLELDQKELKRAEIAKAVRKLMVDDEGAAKELRKRAEELKLKARQSVRESGSSYDSLNRLVDRILSF